MRDWTARTQRVVPRGLAQPAGIQGVRSLMDDAILGGLSRKEPQRVVRKPLPMRSHSRGVAPVFPGGDPALFNDEHFSDDPLINA